MIIVKIKGGLGNQLFQYALGRHVSQRFSVPLLLDISMYSEYNLHKYRLKNLNIKADIATNSEIEKLSGGNSLSAKLARKFKVLRKSSFRSEVHKFNYDPKLVFGNNLYLDGYWQNQMYFIDIRDILLGEFVSRNGLSISALKYANRIKNSENSVSIHVRRGDYLGVKGIGVLSENYFKNAVDAIQSKYKNLTFYVFSDDISWCKAHFKFVPNINFIENTKNEVDDLFLMSLCNHNIIANSTFSWWGAWLNQFRQKCVIAPCGWRLDIVDSDRIVPPDWILI